MCFNYRKIKIPIEAIQSVLIEMDKDEDNCISVGEVIDTVKQIAKRYALGGKVND